jgi:hypothetical protein
MAKADVTLALAGPLSCGIYAGNHKAEITKNFPKLLNDVLNEKVCPESETRGQYFQDLILADVPKRAAKL